MMTNYSIRLIAVLSFNVLLLAGCTTYVPVAKQQPPEILIRHDNADLLLVNRFIPDELDYNNENKIDVFEKGLSSYMAGIQTGFGSSEDFKLYLADTALASHSAHQPAHNLSREQISYLTALHPVEYVITIDNYNLYFDQEVEVNENEDGSKSKTAYYDLVLETYTTIYDREGIVIRKIKDENRILHDTRGVISGLLAVGPSMGKADRNVELISRELGEYYISKFYPSTIPELRTFYSSKEFKSSAKAYKHQNWDKVEQELMLLTKHPDTKIQGRAAYNLAIFYENMGQYDDMDYWMRRAEEKLGKIPDNDLINNYPSY